MERSKPAESVVSRIIDFGRTAYLALRERTENLTLGNRTERLIRTRQILDLSRQQFYGFNESFIYGLEANDSEVITIPTPEHSFKLIRHFHDDHQIGLMRLEAPAFNRLSLLRGVDIYLPDGHGLLQTDKRVEYYEGEELERYLRLSGSNSFSPDLNLSGIEPTRVDYLESGIEMRLDEVRALQDELAKAIMSNR